MNEPMSHAHADEWRERLEDAAIDAVAHAFQTMFRMSVAWTRGAPPRPGDFAWRSELRGEVTGRLLLTMHGATARRLSAMMGVRPDTQGDDAALRDAVGEIAEILFVSATERAGRVRAAATAFVPTPLDIAARRAGQATRVGFECDAGAFEVIIELDGRPRDAALHEAHAAVCA